MAGKKKTTPHSPGSAQNARPPMPADHGPPQTGFWEWDLETDTIWMADNIKGLIDPTAGRHAPEICFLSTVPPEGASTIAKAMGSTFRRGKPLAIEGRADSQSGAWTTYRINARSVHHRSKEADCLTGILHPSAPAKSALASRVGQFVSNASAAF